MAWVLKPVWVTGMGTHGYGYGYGFLYLWGPGSSKMVKIWVSYGQIDCFNHNSLNTWLLICIIGLWTCKQTNSMFCIMLHIVPIPQVVLQATLHVSTHCSTFLYLALHLHHITSEFHRDYHMTFLLFLHHSIYATYVRQSQSLVSQLIASDQGQVTFLLPLSCFYHILWFISEFSIMIPHPRIVIIVLYSVSFPTLMFLLSGVPYLFSLKFLSIKTLYIDNLQTRSPPPPHFEFKVPLSPTKSSTLFLTLSKSLHCILTSCWYVPSRGGHTICQIWCFGSHFCTALLQCVIVYTTP